MSPRSLLSPQASLCSSAVIGQAAPGGLSLWNQKASVPLCQLGCSSLRTPEEGSSVTWGTLPSFTSLVILTCDMVSLWADPEEGGRRPGASDFKSMPLPNPSLSPPLSTSCSPPGQPSAQCIWLFGKGLE